MAAPKTVAEFVELVQKSNLLEPAKLEAFLTVNSNGFDSPAAIAKKLRSDGLLTPFHVKQLLAGRHKGFFLGKYKILDRIGLGGMGQVFLAEHGSMRRRAALKVLPPERSEKHYSRERFLREARAAGQLDHPNLVRAFDFDEDGDVTFLVMEYVDGVTFHDIVQRTGPLDPQRVANYLFQCTNGLNYLHSCGLVHRDIKPANLLVDRQGIVKILDLGLVRSEIDDDNLTKGEGVKILGTADYLPPEQAIECSKVDVRADIYGLGATAYYMLTGRPPFEGDMVAQKLIAHQTKPIKQIHTLRSDVSEEFSAIITKMLAKKPSDRYQTPAELAEALLPFTSHMPAIPTEAELPAVVGGAYGNPSSVNLSGTSSVRGGGSSINNAPPGQGQISGSAIRYFSDSKLATPGLSGEMAGVFTPQPRSAPPVLTQTPSTLAQTPTPKGLSGNQPKNSIGLPALPAFATHGSTLKPPAKPDKAAIEVPEMFRRAPGEVAEPATAAPKAAPATSASKQWIMMGVALGIVVGVVVYATMSLVGGSTQTPTASTRPAATNP